MSRKNSIKGFLGEENYRLIGSLSDEDEDSSKGCPDDCHSSEDSEDEIQEQIADQSIGMDSIVHSLAHINTDNASTTVQLGETMPIHYLEMPNGRGRWWIQPGYINEWRSTIFLLLSLLFQRFLQFVFVLETILVLMGKSLWRRIRNPRENIILNDESGTIDRLIQMPQLVELSSTVTMVPTIVNIDVFIERIDYCREVTIMIQSDGNFSSEPTENIVEDNFEMGDVCPRISLSPGVPVSNDPIINTTALAIPPTDINIEQTPSVPSPQPHDTSSRTSEIEHTDPAEATVALVVNENKDNNQSKILPGNPIEENANSVIDINE